MKAMKKNEWTQRASGRNAKGHSCSAEDPEAIKWCLVGWLVRESEDDDVFIERQHLVCKKINPGYSASVLSTTFVLTQFNDARGRTYEEIKAVLEGIL